MKDEVICKTRGGSMFFTFRVSVNVLLQSDGFLNDYFSIKNSIVDEMSGEVFYSWTFATCY